MTAQNPPAICKPCFLISSSTSALGLWGEHLLNLKELDFMSSTMGKLEDEPDELVDLDAMYCAETALAKVSLLPKACFVPGKAVHVQFDGSS